MVDWDNPADVAAFEALRTAEIDACAARADWPGHPAIDPQDEADPVLDVLPEGHPAPAEDDDIDLNLDDVTAAWATDVPEAADGPQDDEPEQAIVGYRAAHARVQKARGAARGHRCEDCGEQAHEWSYSHGDPDELIADDPTHAGMAYSLDPVQYAPRCRGCHVKHDKAAARRRRGEPGKVTAGWEARTSPMEVRWDLRRTVRGWCGLPDQPLDDVLELLDSYIGAQDDADLINVALWIAGTHLAARGVGHAFPRLAVIAPTYGAGKSTLLELIARLSHAGEVIGSTITDALLPRILLDQGFSTLCFDEADKTLRPENTNAVAVLNAGWQRGGSARINLPSADGGWRPTKIDVFSPVALAGNGVRLAPDTEDRTITVRLIRRADVPELRWSELPGLDDRLRARLAAWADEVAGRAAVKRPPMPQGVGGRDRDRWSILASAAEGTSRADWREAVEAACVSDHETRVEARETAGRAWPEQLLVDLFEALPDADAWPTENVVDRLIVHAPDRYGVRSGHEMTATKLGRDLARFWSVSSQRLTINGERRRGIKRADLERAWRQLRLIDTPIE